MNFEESKMRSGRNACLGNVTERGYTLAGALVLLAIMAIFMALAVPLWSRVKQRDNEEELIFRGSEYIEAIARYHAKFATYPPDIETLVKLKYLRHEYLDPMTKSGKWKVLHPDALVQTGAAGTINRPGQGQGQNPGVNPGGPGNSGGGSLMGDDDDDDDNSADGQNNQPGLGSDDDKDKDEEPEVESIGPVVGVVSRSKKASIRIYNGQEFYNKWVFVYALQQPQRGPLPPQGGGQRPGGSGGNPNQGGAQTGGNQPGGNRPPPQPQPQQSGDDDDDGGD